MVTSSLAHLTTHLSKSGKLTPSLPLINSNTPIRDRRSLGNSQKPSGVLIGHTEGITYVAPKGDGRYVISNGKDQTLKLWDLRKMVSFSDFLAVKDDDYGIPDFDYRYVSSTSDSPCC